MNRKVRRKVFLGVLMAVSIMGIFLSPLSEIRESLIENLPWITVGAIISETMFVLGLLIIAAGVGAKLKGWPWKWRTQLMPVIRKSKDEGVLFWVGFTINLIGAIGSGAVVGVGIILTLPWQSWGLLIFPFLDLIVTFAVRAAALNIIEEDKVQPPA